MKVELIRPTTDLLSSYLEFIAEMKQAGEKIWESTIQASDESPKDFVARLLYAEVSSGPSLVPETTYWGTSDSKVVGRIALRHFLNEQLSEFGGHIGYEVRPSARRQGVATEMLRLLLTTPKAKEIGRLLLTCAPNNAASNKTIVTNGGVLEKTVWVERVKRDTNLYWIDLSK